MECVNKEIIYDRFKEFIDRKIEENHGFLKSPNIAKEYLDYLLEEVHLRVQFKMLMPKGITELETGLTTVARLYLNNIVRLDKHGKSVRIYRDGRPRVYQIIKLLKAHISKRNRARETNKLFYTYLKQHPNLTRYDIMKSFGWSEGKVYHYLKKLEAQKKIIGKRVIENNRVKVLYSVMK